MSPLPPGFITHGEIHHFEMFTMKHAATCTYPPYYAYVRSLHFIQLRQMAGFHSLMVSIAAVPGQLVPSLS